MVRKIKWQENIKGPITTWYGKIGSVLYFTIDKFKSDPGILTSKTFPMDMMTNVNIDRLKLNAQFLLEAHYTSLQQPNPFFYCADMDSRCEEQCENCKNFSDSLKIKNESN